MARNEIAVGTKTSTVSSPIRIVEFTAALPGAKSVYLAGTFNRWDSTKTVMHRGMDGIWRVNLALAAGRYEYQFVADGHWLADPKARRSLPNPYGGVNSMIEI